MPRTRMHLPDTLSAWPWPRRLNQHYETCKVASTVWLESFHAFTPEGQAAFNACDVSLLASLAYPAASKEQLRIACDLLNLIFLIDEYTDVVDERGARHMCDAVMAAMRSDSTAGKSVLGRCAKDFWLRLCAQAHAGTLQRFRTHFARCMAATMAQAADRTNAHVHETLAAYLAVRRDTIGLRACIALLELDRALPEEVFADADVEAMTASAVDMVLLANDMCSYKAEHARGDDAHNIITVLMRGAPLDVHAALHALGTLHDEHSMHFIAARARLAARGEVAAYVDGIANMVRANVELCGGHVRHDSEEEVASEQVVAVDA